MNSDPFTSDTPPPVEVAPEEAGTTAPRRRRGARRTTAQALPEQAAPEPAVGAAPEEETPSAPPTRTRRRRAARAATGVISEAEAPEAAPQIPPTEDVGLPPGEDVGLPPGEETLAPAEGVAAGEAPDEGPPARMRRRRRSRGARGAVAEGTAEAAAVAEAEAVPAAQEADLAEPDLAMPEPEEAPPLSPAVSRRFDHRNWRDRPGRLAATAPTAARAAPSPEPEAPVPFGRRSERGTRYGGRQRLPDEMAAPAQPAAASVPPITPPPMAPIVMPSATAPSVTGAPFTPAAPEAASVEERLERLLASQAALLQQQQQAFQSMVATMTALQGSIERMSTTGIAAGMPRAGVFVDAPNVVYAAESARVTIDYGRMLDFLGRGRELVHAIVYAPVTEDGGYRFEGQRFVAPFLGKGYKLVTKPLKRFPDGTAKGNFDIELAIDIVTMSQRLDVVILISGDSDFSRLIELIQSRGVRVEVVAFAANVSWELVQMADVFIDIGQYLREFQPV